MTFSEWVEQKRLEYGYSARELADRSGVSESSIYQLKATKTNSFNYETMRKLCNAFGVDTWRVLKKIEEAGN